MSKSPLSFLEKDLLNILLLQTSFGLILNYCCPQEEFVNNALQFFKGNGYELLLYDQLKIDRGMYYTAQC